MGERSVPVTQERPRSVPARDMEHAMGHDLGHDMEEVIGGIFQDVLATDEPVDVSRSFFRVGGTSIMAAKVVARISARYRVRLSLRTIFEFPAVRDLARVVESEVRRDVSGLSDAEVVAMTTRER